MEPQLQMRPDEQEIREVHAAWINAVNAGDLDRLLTLMTEDVVFLNPGRPPLDRDGFSASFPAAPRQVRIDCISELEEVVIAGDVAYTRSRDALSVTPLVGEEVMQFAGDRMTIYRKQPEGRWLLARDIHTLSPVDT
jgi:uncharacterized protein (TIGR02246 family)